MNIYILLFDGVDLLDSGGPYEVFLTASRLVRRDGGEPPFEVITVTRDGRPVTAYGGLGLTPHARLPEALSKGVLIVPGTIDIHAVIDDRQLMDALKQIAKCRTLAQETLVASVCTGAFLLAEIGLLDGLKWTTHWEDIGLLSERLGIEGATRNTRWVDEGSVVTAAGLSSGIDMALHLVDRLAGRELAERTARQIDYPWHAEGQMPALPV